MRLARTALLGPALLGPALVALLLPAAQAQVVLRERVEVPARAAQTAPGPVAASSASACDGPIVGERRYVGASGQNGATPWVSGLPLDGTVTVQTACGGTFTAPWQNAFAPLVTQPTGHAGTVRYLYSPLTDPPLLVVPLRATEDVVAGGSVSVPEAGFSAPLTTVWIGAFGCAINDAACVASSPHAVKGGALGITSTIVGHATGRTYAWPDSVACGSTTPLPVTYVKPDGTEGYVGPGTELTYRVFGAGPPLAYEGAPDAAVQTAGYLDARAGRVAYRAPACNALTPLNASRTVTATGQVGAQISHVFHAVDPCAAGKNAGIAALCALPPFVRLLRQNDTPVPESHVMISFVRPDWLLPPSVGFATSTGRTRAYPNDAAPDSSDYDPRTYRGEILSLPDSLEARGGQIRFRYVVTGPGHRAETALDGAAVVRDSTLGLRARGNAFVRLVSRGRPPMGAVPTTGCAPWPLSGGACLYDDEVVPNQTLLARLGDSLHVSAWYVDGATEHPIQKVAFRVGQAPGDSTLDAVRRVRLVWRRYQRAGGITETAYPDLAVKRLDEEWASASIRFVNEAAADADSVFTAPGTTNVLSLRMSRRLATADTLSLLVRVDADQDTVSVPLPAGASLNAVTNSVRFAIRDRFGLADSEVGNIVDERRGGAVTRRLLVVSRADRASVSVLISPDNRNLRIPDIATPLERPRSGSEAILAYGLAYHDRQNATLEAFVVPDLAIAYGDRMSSVGARATDDSDDTVWVPNIVFVSEDAADGDDVRLASVLSHEIGHTLLVKAVPGGPGGPECSTSQAASHHPAPWNLLYCQTPDRGLRIGGPRRLTAAMQQEARCESGSAADAVAASDCPTGFDSDRSPGRALLHPDL